MTWDACLTWDARLTYAGCLTWDAWLTCTSCLTWAACLTRSCLSYLRCLIYLRWLSFTCDAYLPWGARRGHLLELLVLLEFLVLLVMLVLLDVLDLIEIFVLLELLDLVVQASFPNMHGIWIFFFILSHTIPALQSWAAIFKVQCRRNSIDIGVPNLW